MTKAIKNTPASTIEAGLLDINSMFSAIPDMSPARVYASILYIIFYLFN